MGGPPRGSNSGLPYTKLGEVRWRIVGVHHVAEVDGRLAGWTFESSSVGVCYRIVNSPGIRLAPDLEEAKRRLENELTGGAGSSASSSRK